MALRRIANRALASLFAHDLFGKPLHTFPDHVLYRQRSRLVTQRSTMFPNTSACPSMVAPSRLATLCETVLSGLMVWTMRSTARFSKTQSIDAPVASVA